MPVTIFPTHTPETAPEAARAAMIKTAAEFGAVPAAVARQATSPELLNGFLAASAAFEHSSLDPIAQEVVIMIIAVRNGCRVCIGIHSARLRKLGRGELIKPLRDQAALDDPALEAARLFTLRLLNTTGEVPDQQLQEFLDAGFTLQNALEIVFGIGAYTMSTFANRLVRA